MLLVDRRVGSKDLVAPLIKSGIPTELTELQFGDIAFRGNGANGTTLDIGIELKTLSDLVGSLRTGRLAGHQLLGLHNAYSPYAWLVVEGQWRTNDSGHVVTYQGKQRGWVPVHGKMTGSELEKQVLTLELCGGLHVRYTNSRVDTIRFIHNLYRWFTDRAVDEHTSHLVVYHPPTLLPVSAFRQVVTTLPGVGYRISRDVEDYFGTLGKAFAAPVTEWQEVPGIGKKRAQEIVNVIQGT